MKTHYFIQLILISTLALVFASCVPKATEKKASCGTNQYFNNITRSCVSSVEPRTKPVGTLGSGNLTQETAKTFILTYTDGNNNPALSCRVTSPSANIEAISPTVINGGVFSKMDLLVTTINNLYNALPASPQQTAAQAHLAPLTSAQTSAKATFTYSTLIASLASVNNEAQAVIDQAFVWRLSYTNVMTNYNLAVSSFADFNTYRTIVSNRCECSGGVCTTTISPMMRQNGPAGFTYTITDMDGEGDPKTVSLSIAAASNSSSYLKPVVESSYVATFAESATSTPATYSFTLPSARDYFGTTAFDYTFNGTKNGSNQGVLAKGVVYGCMDLAGSTGLTDTTCSYKPNSGDTFYSGAAPVEASVDIQGLHFQAIAKGTFGNNFTVQLVKMASTNAAVQAENFGLVSQTYPDTYIRVIDNAITVYVSDYTTAANIVNAVNNDSKAKSLIVASNVSASTFTSMASPASLTGGTDAFDKVAYTVSNGYASSTNAATVMFTMVPTDDAPYMNYTASTPSKTALEDSGAIVVDLAGTYADVDSTIDACDVHMAGVDSNVDATVEASFLANFKVNGCTCDVAGKCSASVTPNANVSSSNPFYFYYRVASLGLYSDYRMASVTVTPVNDAPILGAVAAQTILENSTAAPSFGKVSVTVDPGGGGFESTQTLTLALNSNNTTLLPNATCTNYTPGAGSPNGSVTPVSSGVYYFDTTNFACYVSTGTTNTSWKLYPSLTAFPSCAYDFYGQGAPAVAPTAAGKHYLDTTNNKCYKSSSTTVASWALDSTVTSFTMAYVPVANQSGAATITMTLTDSGGTANGGVNSSSNSFGLTVTSVDDPPYFISALTIAHTNEGGLVVAGPFKVDEDQGSSADEDAQPMSVTSITSDNTSVLPTSAISIFYDLNDNGVEDTGESRTLGQTLENAAGDDSKLHNFYLKLNPIAGVSGNANITVTVNDGNPAASHSVTTTFSLVVHPIAALHGGWANISAIGLKTDKNGAPAADADVQCNYNKTSDLNACDGHQNCTGTSSPHAINVPDAANVLYYDSANKKCYRATAASDKFSWVEFKTSCPVTRQAGNCSSENCISASAPVPTAAGQYYYNTSNNLCYISTGTAAGNWIGYTPAKVSLTWNSFTVSGSGADSTVTVYGWNVYRREKGYDFDFANGFLKNNSADTMTISDATVRTFTDKTAVAGKVYYYLVRPVDSSTRHLTISTPEVFSEVRVLAPTENYAFVHRWMVNQEVCNSMHMTTSTSNKVDPTHNYRCPYKGPGESQVSPGYYDIEKDMLVDISESGCPYSPAPKCTSNGCVGIGDPPSIGATGMSANDIYYDRSAGKCYLYNGAAWSDYNSAALNATIVAKTNTALNAPLTNISKARASAICQQRSTASALSNLGIANGAMADPVTAPVLPTKKEFIAYAAAPYNMSDSVITDLEQGYSLNVQSRCNSSNANGIDTAFTDSLIPSTSYIFSLPGTASSTIRSIYTGSVPWGMNFSTEACSSRYGIQDVYGNVAEWVQDSMSCGNGTTANGAILVGDATITVASTANFPTSGTLIIESERITYTGTTATTFTGVTRGVSGTTAAAHSSGTAVNEANYVCVTNTGTDLAQYDFQSGNYAVSPAIPTYRYKFDLTTGPFNDVNTGITGPDSGDGWPTNWDFKDELFGAGKFSFPVGMPINVDIGSTVLSSAPALSYLLDIGPTAGITTSQLHEDGIIVNGAAVNDPVNNPTITGSFAQGGSYFSGNRSGRYSSELVPDASPRSDIGFRCYIPIDKTNYPADTGRHTYSY